MSITQSRLTRKPMNTDSRYRHGVNTVAEWHRERNEAKRKREAEATMHPMTHGWLPAYRHPVFEQTVYMLGSAKMMYRQDRDGWQVDIGDESWLCTGEMIDITADVRRHLPQLTPAQVAERQREWGAAHPDFSNGVA